MGSGSKQPVGGMPVLCMVLVLMVIVMASAVQASSSRKMAASFECTHHHHAQSKQPFGEFKSATDWVRDLVKAFCYHHHDVHDHHRCYGRQWDFAVTEVEGIRAVCIPKTQSLLEKHEGRHECAYNKSDGSRAVGVGYNLDDDPDTRRSELSGVLANYDKVYKGEECLNNFQISALLALDAKRALDRAANSVASLDDQCCSVMAVFGDIQHSAGSEVFETREFEEFVEAVSAKNWEKAAKKLEETKWCQKHEHRCEDDADIIRQGCDGSVIAAAAAAASASISMITDATATY